MPPTVKARLPELLDRARAALAPCDLERLTMHLSVLGAYLPAKANAQRPEIWIRETRQALAHWPDDLVERAMTKAKAECRFLPVIAELTEFVADSLRARNRASYRLKLAQAWAEKEPEPFVPSSHEEIDAVLKESGFYARIHRDDRPAVDYSNLRQPTEADYAALRADMGL